MQSEWHKRLKFLAIITVVWWIGWYVLLSFLCRVVDCIGRSGCGRRVPQVLPFCCGCHDLGSSIAGLVIVLFPAGIAAIFYLIRDRIGKHRR
jgi:hypothetical protein